jgi:hypothetical protein
MILKLALNHSGSESKFTVTTTTKLKSFITELDSR